MFKCSGAPPPPTVVVASKKSSRAKKKNVKFSKRTHQMEVAPQNSFKFEPETIIDQNVEGTDEFDAVDNSYMESHFADSDNELDANDTTMTLADSTVESTSGTKESDIGVIAAPPNENSSKDAPTCSSTTSIRPTLDHQLLECRVKLEPLDVSNLQISINTEPVEPTPRPTPTVPPLTIRIKKEVMRPGYGDDFDMNIAQNIKQERTDETWELASTSSEQRHEHSGHPKKSKTRNKEKKLYKKPALLAIKIKQERMEREANDDEQEYGTDYNDYSMPSDENFATMSSQPFENNPLPIITQIHSVIDPSAIIPLASEPLKAIVAPQPTNSMPFVPIRIKSEFQRPPSPSPAPASVVHSETEHPSDETDSAAISADNVEKMTEPMKPTEEPVDENKDMEKMECDTSCPIEETSDLKTSSKNDEDSTDKIKEMNTETAENIYDEQPKLNTDIANNCQPPASSIENIPNLPVSDLPSHKQIDQPQNEVPCEYHAPTEAFETDCSQQNAVATDSNTNDIAESAPTIDSTSQDSIEVGEQLEEDADKDEPILHSIKPVRSEDNDDMDVDVATDSSIISPIDFIEPTNDESLNFIDQLVHEVADTMVPHTIDDDDKAVTPSETSAIDTMPSVPFETTNYYYNMNCSAGSAEHAPKINDDESNFATIDQVAKTATNDSLLTLSDMPDIDYNDLLPALDATEPKPNAPGIDSCPPNLNDDDEIANLMQTDAISEDDQPKNDLSYQQNNGSN